MKLLIAILIALSTNVYAAETTAPIVVNKLQAVDAIEEPARQPGLFIEGMAHGNSKSNPQARLGHFIGRHFLLSASYLHNTRSDGTSGGNLESWNYVETSHAAESKRSFIELTYFLFPLTLKTSSPYITLAVGEAQETVGYSYTRYKPYNGTFCLGTCPKMAVEDSDGGTTSYKERLTSVSAGYLWHVFLGYPGLTIRAGATYLRGPGDKTFTFGTTHSGSTSSIHNEEFSAEVALGIDFPNWF